jgi:hypothetical protein
MARKPWPAVPILTGALVQLNHWLNWAHRELTVAIGDYSTLDERLDAIEASAGGGAPAAHATSHEEGGSDEVDGDALASAFSPSNYAPTDTNIGGQFAGVDAALIKARTTHCHGRVSIATANSPQYFYPEGRRDQDTFTLVIQDHQARWAAGIITNFTITILTASADADTADWALNLNGSDTTLKISAIPGNATGTYGPDTSQVTTADGDLLCVTRTNTAGGTSFQDLAWSFDFIASL